MTGCITKDLKDLLISLLEAEVPPLTLKMVIEKSFPTCAGTTGPAPAVKTTTREFAERWPSAIYVDPNGVKHDYNSPSALYEKLTGTKLSGSICLEEGNRCYPATTVESFRIQGYIVEGDGEDPPASDPLNWLSSGNVKRQATIDAHNAWKQHLLATGKKFIVLDPIWVKMQAKKEGIEQ
jgi:hypothetical protein